MTTFTIAGDEAGDANFNFEKGASRYFVVAVVATQDADGLRFVLENLRRRENYSQEFEFHFNALTTEKLREKTLSALQNADFKAWALVVDKTTVPELLRILSGMDFTYTLLRNLLTAFPWMSVKKVR